MATPSHQTPPGPGAAVPFAITGPAQLILAPDRTGSTTFTVTNLTGRPLTVRMEPKAAPPAQDAWFRPVGDSEILMAVGATLTVEVRAQVPVDAPAGSTTLKLRAVDEAEPERLTDGPAVEVVVPAPPAPAKKVPWIPIVAAVVALLVLAGAALWWFVLRPTPPVNTDAPSIAATARVGGEIAGEEGAWEGDPEFTFQWYRCEGTACTQIEGATAVAYTPGLDDASKELELRVTGTNDDGPTVASSNRARVAQAPPTADVQPEITGTAEEGSTLTLSPGTWSGSPTLTQQWLSCTSADEASCAPIAGATGASLALDATLTTRYVYALVTALNDGGETQMPTARVGPIGVMTVIVPNDLVGMGLARAQDRLDSLGLDGRASGINTWCSPVTGSSPVGGTAVPRGSRVSLTVQLKDPCLRFDLPFDRLNPRFIPIDDIIKWGSP